MEKDMTIVDADAERLAAGFNRARKMWGPFGVVWADQHGRVSFEPPGGPGWVELQLGYYAMGVDEARQVLDRLAGELALERCLVEQERRSAVMAGTVRQLGAAG
jgi:hypothetical protein